MASVNKVICPACCRDYLRTNKQINQVVKRSGIWRCQSCVKSERNVQNARPIGSTRLHSQSGYIEEKTEHGWQRQHIAVMERIIGRRLMPGEAVHHINEVKTDNRQENLRLMSHAEHTIIHHTGAKRTSQQVERIKAGVRGSRVARISLAIAESIREAVRDSGTSQRAIAAAFGVSPMTVSRVVNNKTWS